jgi:hypothetical protein
MIVRFVASTLLRGFAVIVAAMGTHAAAQDDAHGCRLSPSDRSWAVEALAAWQFVAREKLQIGGRPLPRIILFDERCSYSLLPGAGQRQSWIGRLHGGKVRLPNRQTLSIVPTAYAASDIDTGMGFFVMSLPAIWRAAGHRTPLGLEAFLQGVMIHELTHTYQYEFLSPLLNRLSDRNLLAPDQTDESLQRAFRANASYVADFERERDILFRAAATPDEQQARMLACEALARMRARRGKYFVGANARWAPLDELYLTMEGEGQWAMYSWWTDPRAKGLAPAIVLPQIRSASRSWVQDEGLALFLVIDRLIPSWQRLAFARRSETAGSLLARACGRQDRRLV